MEVFDSLYLSLMGFISLALLCCQLLFPLGTFAFFLVGELDFLARFQQFHVDAQLQGIVYGMQALFDGVGVIFTGILEDIVIDVRILPLHFRTKKGPQLLQFADGVFYPIPVHELQRTLRLLGVEPMAALLLWAVFLPGSGIQPRIEYMVRKCSRLFPVELSCIAVPQSTLERFQELGQRLPLIVKVLLLFV